MKIIDIKPVIVNAEMRNWVFVKVVTDEGIIGWGEATIEWKTRGVVGTIEDLTPLLIGKDPLNITYLCEIMNKHSFWKLGVIGKTAISGIEIALWDVMGKVTGMPIWKLLGGKTRDKVKLYTHLGFGESSAVYDDSLKGSLSEKALTVLEKGYQALKIVCIPYLNYTSTTAQVKKVYAMMEEIRLAVGDDIDIMVDFHGRPGSASSSLDFIRAIEPFKPLFVEEVIQPGDSLAMSKIKDKIDCPLASGERLVSPSEFLPLFEKRAIDIAQPDLCHCGGFSAAKKIADMAALFGVGIAPHNPLGPIAGIAALHFDIATPNFVIQEKMDAVPWFYEVVPNQPEMKEGYWEVPELPGLGVGVNEEVASKYPFKQEPVRFIQEAVLTDGTIVDW